MDNNEDLNKTQTSADNENTETSENIPVYKYILAVISVIVLVSFVVLTFIGKISLPFGKDAKTTTTTQSSTADEKVEDLTKNLSVSHSPDNKDSGTAKVAENTTEDNTTKPNEDRRRKQNNTNKTTSITPKETSKLRNLQTSGGSTKESSLSPSTTTSESTTSESTTTSSP